MTVVTSCLFSVPCVLLSSNLFSDHLPYSKVFSGSSSHRKKYSNLIWRRKARWTLPTCLAPSATIHASSLVFSNLVPCLQPSCLHELFLLFSHLGMLPPPLHPVNTYLSLIIISSWEPSWTKTPTSSQSCVRFTSSGLLCHWTYHMVLRLFSACVGVSLILWLHESTGSAAMDCQLQQILPKCSPMRIAFSHWNNVSWRLFHVNVQHYLIISIGYTDF